MSLVSRMHNFGKIVMIEQSEPTKTGGLRSVFIYPDKVIDLPPGGPFETYVPLNTAQVRAAFENYRYWYLRKVHYVLRDRIWRDGTQTEHEVESLREVTSVRKNSGGVDVTLFFTGPPRTEGQKAECAHHGTNATTHHTDFRFGTPDHVHFRAGVCSRDEKILIGHLIHAGAGSQLSFLEYHKA
jgi:hypothetical protein